MTRLRFADPMNKPVVLINVHGHVALATRSALADALALLMNLRGWSEDRLTPEWVRTDDACAYVTLSRANRRST
jgi:hypothetical protein